MSQERIHAKMTIKEILGKFPQHSQGLAREITNAGLHCIGCNASNWETLEVGMLGHGKTQEEIDELVRRLNALLEEEFHYDTISLTQEAAEKFIEFAKQDGKQGWALRFGQRMAGCNGFEYILDFSKEASSEDEVFVSCGIEIHVEKDLLPFLKGSKIGYRTSLNGTGFEVMNPNVHSSCGCGSSHGYK